MTHLAIDLSLSRSGLCWGTGPNDFTSYRCPAKLRGGERIGWWRRRIREHIHPDKDPRITAIVVEEAFLPGDSRARGARPLIELHGGIKHMAWTAKLPLFEVPVQTIKAFAVKGGCSKEEMIDAAKAIGLHPDNDDEADAIHLWRFWAQRERGAA